MSSTRSSIWVSATVELPPGTARSPVQQRSPPRLLPRRRPGDYGAAGHAGQGADALATLAAEAALPG